MMRIPWFLILFAALARLGLAGSDPVVGEVRIKVFLFGAAAFYSEVAVDVRNDTCFSLDNNMIDGSVTSVLVGGHDPWEVMSRDDHWYCVFYDNYDCAGTEGAILVLPGGANNLASAGWNAKVHGIRCVNEPA